jgi:Flp pilus assembly protein TadD
VYEKLGDHGLAESALRRVVALAPQNVLAQVNLGILLNESHKFQEASVILKKVSEVDGSNARMWSALGRAQLELGDSEAAESSLRRSLSLDDMNPYAHNNLGVLLQRQGKRREARKEFEVALRLRPEMELARQNLEAVGGSVPE